MEVEYELEEEAEGASRRVLRSSQGSRNSDMKFNF